jgi:hypothetical protein
MEDNLLLGKYRMSLRHGEIHLDDAYWCKLSWQFGLGTLDLLLLHLAENKEWKTIVQPGPA